MRQYPVGGAVDPAGAGRPAADEYEVGCCGCVDGGTKAGVKAGVDTSVVAIFAAFGKSKACWQLIMPIHSVNSAMKSS